MIGMKVRSVLGGELRLEGQFALAYIFVYTLNDERHETCLRVNVPPTQDAWKQHTLKSFAR